MHSHHYAQLQATEIDPEAPPWFTTAIGTEPRTGQLTVEGVSIRYARWGPAHGKQPIVLVHGGAAHAYWWAPLAPLLAEATGRGVVAVDLSGHGVSDRRPVYSMSLWVSELRALIEHLGQGGTTVVAHSMGGIVGAELSLRGDSPIDRFVAVDAPIWSEAPPPPGATSRAVGQKIYPSIHEALSRFRPMPRQAVACPWYARFIARHGLVSDGAGWSWRHDPRVFADSDEHGRIARFTGDPTRAACPVDLIFGHRSFLRPAAEIDLLPWSAGQFRVLANAGHHIILDQPLALLDTLTDLLRPTPPVARISPTVR
ncbi:alpha/beta fold hydrolase [Nocardia grenadensis]